MYIQVYRGVYTGVRQMKQTPLKRKKGLNPMSAKKRAKSKAEVEVRKEVCHRAEGTWIEYNSSMYGGICLSGKCERCGDKQPYGQARLHPHHIVFTSQGGKTNPENLIMVCPDCHAKLHNINVVHSQPQWSKG